MKTKPTLLTLLLILLLVVDTQAQCSMCRAVLESEGDAGLAKGVNNGIIFLMAVPYVLVGIVGYAIYRIRYKGKSEPTEG